ncbi:hypothetical protein [Xanthomonas translucens]|uniref:hypothetical protein n=1 Tax=Xanthomonas campestris pv. translucens TaxID=343 RepID=UPI00071E8E45|nr:hypothetical protein [Xanthomonas translucens]QEN93663.1 hypothetical protein F0H33_09970 [Xanthomonas translucens pv. undulosa]QSQ58022.1 hypothetical protein ISN37_08850 [Xanthomonas translucens pv. undulosa]UPU47734.1 hypothetical protein MZO50_13325 [Xanthomonas translucens pv. undulosa]WLA02828.1 hypothetical protein MO330_10085 [Xanthomonas translucens]WLA06578.1 hypothetical protein MO329_10015 [Xanthomonas translucens]
MSRSRRGRLTIERPGNPGLYQIAALPGWEVIGTVTDADGAGALIRNKATGIYCRANAGALRSLPQRKVEAALNEST